MNYNQDYTKMNIAIPKFIRNLFPNIVWSIKPIPDKKTLYLTFDDGPIPVITKWVLDTLKEHNAKATFFCIAKNIELHPEIYKEIIEQGHSIGNHTYSHIKGWGTSSKEYINDVTLAEQYIESNLFRPPYARSTHEQIRELSKKYHIILWSILSRDYSRHISPKGCAQNVVNNLSDGAIVVFHDSKKAFNNLQYALVKTLEAAKDQGYECRRIELKDKI